MNDTAGKTSPNDISKKNNTQEQQFLKLQQKKQQIQQPAPTKPLTQDVQSQTAQQTQPAQRSVQSQPAQQIQPAHRSVQSQQNTQSQPQTASPYGYDNAVDYMALINEAVAQGNYQQAAIYEQQRNAKIAGEGLAYEQTSNYVGYLPGGNAGGQEQTNQGAVSSGSADGQEQTNPNDLSSLISQLYDKEAERLKTELNYETQASVDQLNRALQDAQPTYEAAIANQLLETKQAQDAQALYNQMNGDRGGIGSAQMASIGNTGAKNREAIAAQQRQLATDTARQIADLRAQGKFQEANLLLQNSQQKLAALYDEQVRLQQMQEQQNEILSSLGMQYLSAGVMPSDDMLSAMGIDRATAQRYIALVMAQTAGSSGSSSGNRESGDDYKINSAATTAALGAIVGATGLTGGGSNGKIVPAEDRKKLAAMYVKGGDDAIAGTVSDYKAQGYDYNELWNWIHENYNAPWWKQGVDFVKNNGLLP